MTSGRHEISAARVLMSNAGDSVVLISPQAAS